MRRNIIHGVLVVLCITATTQAVIILPMAKPKPGDTPDPTNVVIDLGDIRLDPLEEKEFVCPQDLSWPCIGSVQLKGRLPGWYSAGVSVWLDCVDTLGQTVTVGKQGVAARDFVYQQAASSWATGVSLCIQNLADKQVAITNASLTITYVPDPATLALLAIGTAVLLIRREF